jgi:hypothetical protein
MTFTSTTRTFAIDPTTPGFAWVLIEGLHTLVAYGSVQVPLPRNRNCLLRADALLTTYRPDVLVLEDCTVEGARRSKRAAELIEELGTQARLRKVRTVRLSRERVVEGFAPEAKRKHEIAVALCERFPELRSRLPRVRRPWESEDERMNIFDALALAVIAADEASGNLPVINF